MQKRIAILFLLVFSVSMTEAGQILRLPLLVEHYFDHSEKKAENSLIDFLKSHYLYHHADDGDENEDNNLPFKTLNYGIVSLSFLPSVIFDITYPCLPATDYPLHTVPFLFSDPLFGVFHPPRIA